MYCTNLKNFEKFDDENLEDNEQWSAITIYNVYNDLKTLIEANSITVHELASELGVTQSV